VERLKQKEAQVLSLLELLVQKVLQKKTKVTALVERLKQKEAQVLSYLLYEYKSTSTDT
jgi:hypothetical protein